MRPADRPGRDRRHWDAIIAGGGLAGLSLAAHLAAGGWHDRSVLLVDDPDGWPAAQGWGFWSARPGLLDAAVSRGYHRVRTHAAGADRLLDLGRYRYCRVRRADLRAVVDGIVGDCPGYLLRQGHVSRVDPSGTVTVDGEELAADWVFDSVTPPPDAPVDAWLSFSGWEVRCAEPVFDPAAPVLFDFRTPQGGAARFVYVLPDDARRALVELTEFGPRSTGPSTVDSRKAALAGYLAEVAGAGRYEVLRTESAALPLRTRPVARRRGRVLRIGAAAGLIKASTGYAYQRIQRDSAAIARSLARHDHPWRTPARPRRYRWLDAVLLDLLDREPGRLEATFGRLFATNPAQRVLRFLDEDSRVPSDLRLIAGLPPMPYLRAAAGLLRRGPGTSASVAARPAARS